LNTKQKFSIETNGNMERATDFFSECFPSQESTLDLTTAEQKYSFLFQIKKFEIKKIKKNFFYVKIKMSLPLIKING